MTKYNYIGKTSEGLIRVKNGTFPNFQCGYINESAQEVIPLIYTGVRDFSEGLAAVKTGNWSMGKWGFIDTGGKLVIPCLFDKPRPFSCGMAKVIYNGEWCFIDGNGNKVISLRNYDGSSRFHNGFALVSKRHGAYSDGVYGVIDKTGVEVIPCTVKCYELGVFFKCPCLEESVDRFKKRFEHFICSFNLNKFSPSFHLAYEKLLNIKKSYD